MIGEVISSEEGDMHWVKKDELSKVKLVNDFNELLQVIIDDNFKYFRRPDMLQVQPPALTEKGFNKGIKFISFA